jgi:hypothetical protein
MKVNITKENQEQVGMIKILNKVTKLFNDLEWERDRMSTSGQETLDKYADLLEDFKKGKIK